MSFDPGLPMVCPLTNTDRGIPFHVPVAQRTKLTGFVMAEQVKSVDEVQEIIEACSS